MCLWEGKIKKKIKFYLIYLLLGLKGRIYCSFYGYGRDLSSI